MIVHEHPAPTSDSASVSVAVGVSEDGRLVVTTVVQMPGGQPEVRTDVHTSEWSRLTAVQVLQAQRASREDMKARRGGPDGG